MYHDCCFLSFFFLISSHLIFVLNCWKITLFFLYRLFSWRYKISGHIRFIHQTIWHFKFIEWSHRSVLWWCLGHSLWSCLGNDWCSSCLQTARTFNKRLAKFLWKINQFKGYHILWMHVLKIDLQCTLILVHHTVWT